MSNKPTDGGAGMDGWVARGRGGGRGRPGRGRGRGRGSSFSFPASARPDASSGDNDAIPSPSANGHVAVSDVKRKPFRKSSNARRGSTAAVTIEETVATSTGSKPPLEKELPPHIAGAAVDAESLVNRVKELAINGHGHTSSVESRFSTHFDWADEEDDPDSLPDLDDWAVPSKPTENLDKKPLDAPTVQESTIPELKVIDPPPATTSTHEEQLEIQEDIYSTPLNGETAQTETVTNVSTSVPTGEAVPPERPITPKKRPGLEASIWASSPPTSPPASSTTARPPRGRGHARSASYRPSTNPNQAFRPTHFSRNSVAETLSLTPPSAQQQDLKSSPRKPHTRPIISGAALANISRTLGRESPRPQQQSTST